MKTVRRIMLFFIIYIHIFMMAGCWNYREIDQLAIASGIAVDKMENGNYLITAEIISTKPTEKGMETTSEIFSAQGQTIFDGVRNLILRTGKKLYWSHGKVIIISEEIAKQGIFPVLDWVDRDAEVRSDMYLLVSKEKTAREILDSSLDMKKITSFQLDNILKIHSKIYQSSGTELWHFLNDLSTEPFSGTLPTVKIIHDHGIKMPFIYGTAIFKDVKNIGWLDGVETRSFTWITGEEKQKGILITLKGLGSKNADMSLEVFKDEIKRKPIYLDDGLAMDIIIKLDLATAEANKNMNLLDLKEIEMIKGQIEKQLEGQIENTIKKVQREFKCDIFEFGQVIKRENPQLWKRIETHWDEIFPVLKTNVNVEVTIRGSSMTTKTYK